MTRAAKSAVAQDLEQTRRELERARIAVKKASDRSDALVQIDMDLFARSRGQISHARDHLKQEHAPQRPHYLSHPIDRKMVERHLKQAERHAEVGQEHISSQRKRIAQLERDGHDTYEARKLLAQFEELQSMHIAHRDRLARQLGCTI
jgi:hypothetical protein